MKKLKKIAKWLLIVLIILNVIILLSGKSYLYKGVFNTYLQGRSGPSINEYKIFENRELKTATPQPWPLAKDYNKAAIPEKYLPVFERLKSIAFLVIKDDSLRYEKYWENYGPSSATNSFSMAKTFVSILIGAAIKDGKIKNVDQPVKDFLPEFKEEKPGTVTIKHLLMMASGIDFDEDYVNPFAYPAAAYYGSDLKQLSLGYTAREEPGKVFKYLSGNTELLGIILEKATGKHLSDYATEKLWKPMGAEHPAFWSLDQLDGMEKCFCCFNSNARDFARFGQLYLDSGKWKGQELIPADYVAASVQPNGLVDEAGLKVKHYGYQWWMLPNYKRSFVFYARGILGQYIFIIPEKRMVVVRLGHKRDNEKEDDTPKDVYTWLNAALDMYEN
jgi:CubicO group peptidase (beta-lactamase class C family)